CQRGLTQKCRALRKYGHEQFTPEWPLNGGFSTHMQLLAGTTIVTISDDLPPEVAAPLTCGTATAVAALDQAAQITDLNGATVLVTGAGLVGLTAIAIATDRGARVIAADPNPQRRALAERFGAAITADPTLQDAVAGSLADAFRELGAREGVHVVIEASGNAAAVAQAIDALDIGGVAVLVGSVHPVGQVPIDPESMVRGLRSVRGLHNYTAVHLEEAVEYLLERHDAYPFRELVGAEFTLAEIDEAIAMAATGESVRVGVRPAHSL
ncbi:MAG: zinc-binding dehydrogenase, partial [Leucobacter sp.]|nr:zinc-binding dehydrogenase [Leucobacter sp.]